MIVDDPTRPPGELIRQGVSLYSLQEEYFLGTLDLEGQIEACAEIGAPGIEVIPHQTFASYPHLDDAEVDAWFELHDRHGTTPTAYDTFTEKKRRRDRDATIEELLEEMRTDILLSERLGCHIMRVQMNTPIEVFEGSASFAADHGQVLAMEVHAPLHYEHRWVQRFIDAIHRVDDGTLALMGDMSTFVRRFPRVVSDAAIRHGARPELVEYVVSAYESPEPRDMHVLPAEVFWAGGSGIDMGLAGHAGWFGYVEPSTLVPHLPYIVHFQAKFFEMVDDETEYSIPYDEIIDVLLAHRWAGHLSSEYEGNRFIQDVGPVDSVEQLRRQHAMLRTLIGRGA